MATIYRQPPTWGRRLGRVPPGSLSYASCHSLATMDMGWKWKATQHWVQPTSAREVMAVMGSIGVYSTGQRFGWRGLSSADFALTSSLHRKVVGDECDVRSAELEILREARDWGLGNYPTGRVDDLQLLSDLQHFGVPTRLIDMTSNPMTALWFACQPAPEGVAKSGLLLALNVTGWPRLSTVGTAGGLSWEGMADPEGERLRERLADGRPFVLESGAPNARLRAQEGFFIAGPVPSEDPGREIRPGSGIRLVTITPFESISVTWQRTDQSTLSRRLLSPGPGGPKILPFVAIIISANLKAKLLKYLEGTYNRSARVLFPDYEGYKAFGRHAEG